jgi:hypothetical protein
MSTSGCATAVFDPRACPVERSYTRAEQTQLANELAKSGPAVKSAMVDYGKLRDKARACRGEAVRR